MIKASAFHSFTPHPSVKSKTKMFTSGIIYSANCIKNCQVFFAQDSPSMVLLAISYRTGVPAASCLSPPQHAR